jgi:hypothetical protein
MSSTYGLKCFQNVFPSEKTRVSVREKGANFSRIQIQSRISEAVAPKQNVVSGYLIQDQLHTKLFS